MAKSRSARAAAPSRSSRTSPARTSSGRAEAAEVERSGLRDVERQIGLVVRPLGAAIRDPPAPAVLRQERVLQVEHERLLSCVRARGERRADVDEPDEKRVVHPQQSPPRIDERVQERLVDRQVIRPERADPVEPEQEAPELELGPVVAHRLEDPHVARVCRPLPLRDDAVERVRSRHPGDQLGDRDVLGGSVLPPVGRIVEDPRLHQSDERAYIPGVRSLVRS